MHSIKTHTSVEAGLGGSINKKDAQLWFDEIHRVTPFRRQPVDRIDPAGVIVVLFDCNLPKAILHYAKQCSVLPEFCVIKQTLSDGQLSLLIELFSLTICSVNLIASRIDKQLCLFAPGDVVPWQKCEGFIPTYFAARDAGTLRDVVMFDVCSFQDQVWWYRHEPLSITYMLDNICMIINGYAAMADAESREVYAGSICKRLTGESGYIPVSLYKQYYHPLVSPAPGDVIVDGGIDSGWTTVEFSKIVGTSGKVIAFEPNPKVIDPLATLFAPHKNILLEPLGLWSCQTTMYLEIKDAGSSNVSFTAKDGAIPCALIDLDGYLKGASIDRCDMIKLDVEGAELETLRGAVETLRKYRPKLQISVYHHPYEQFFDIINFVIQLGLGYDLFLGHHFPASYETVLYARPR